VCDSDPAFGAEVNLAASLRLLALCRGKTIPFVYASTAGIFGPDDGVVPAPTTQYGIFKLATEFSAKLLWASDRISSVGLRPLTVYGPGRIAGHSAGPTLACRAAVLGEAYTIQFSGETDFIYVDDVAAAFEAALMTSEEGAFAYNVNGVVADTQDFIRTIESRKSGANIRCTGPRVPIAPIRPGADLYDRYPDLKRTNLTDGVSQTIAYYEMGDRWIPPAIKA
jgi:nucleoside-diphosphate-sugar epimerase